MANKHEYMASAPGKCSNVLYFAFIMLAKFCYLWLKWILLIYVELNYTIYFKCTMMVSYVIRTLEKSVPDLFHHLCSIKKYKDQNRRTANLNS